MTHMFLKTSKVMELLPHPDLEGLWGPEASHLGP